MIQVKEIAADEAQKLNSEARSSYWGLPIALTIVLFPITLIFHWLFGAPWAIFWWTSGSLFALSAIMRIVTGAPQGLTAGTMKIIRRGIVIDVARKGNSPLPRRLNLGQHIDITLADEATPPPYPGRHIFTVYQTLGATYYQQDGSLRYRTAHLVGKAVEIEYLAESGEVLAFRELNPASNPPTLYLQWGNIQLSGKKTLLSQKRVDFVSVAPDLYGNTGIFLRSDSVRDELFVPLYTKNLNRLEGWLFALEGFNKEQYRQLKENPPAEDQVIWERRIKYGVSYRSVYAGERVSVTLGNINVYRNNGHNESIRMQEVDYIFLNSLCKDKPNAEFCINLHSFNRSGIAVQSRAEGFNRMENWVKQLPGFDTDEYLATRANVGEKAEVVWLRPPVANAKIPGRMEIPQAITGLDRGIYLENLDRWLEWGTFADLSRLELKKTVSIKKTHYPNPDVRGYTYIVNKPIILGGVELACLQAETPFWWAWGTFNREWPVTSYWADVSFGNGGLEDFERLKRHFTQRIGKPDGLADPAVDGSNNTWAYWLVNRVTIKISIWKPHQLDVFRHSCRLDIGYKANVDHLYTDQYTLGLALHDQLRYVVLEGDLTVASDYTQYPHCRYTPEDIAGLIQTEQQCILWLDEKHAKLGIANKRHAQVLDLGKIAGLSLTGSYWRDNPTELQFHALLNRQTDRRASNYLGALTAGQGDSRWPLIREQLESFLGLPCTYSEDRQYY